MKLSVFEKILKAAIKMKASDIHFKSGVKPTLRVNDTLKFIKNLDSVTDSDLNQIASLVLSKEQREKFNENRRYELDVSLNYKDIGRFRVNVFRGQGGIRIVMRVVNSFIPSIPELGLPPIIVDLANSSRGLIIVTGATGSGKSTTLAAMIEHMNNNHTRHVITIEDPIEYEIPDKKCLITQRELGFDCGSFSSALIAALRQDPDVIMVGEMRDYDTINAAITAAETGHLVLTTLHTIDSTETINRILTVFRDQEQRQVRNQLASSLRAVVSLRLVNRADDRGRVPAVEVMVNNPRVSELILDPQRTKDIPEAISESKVSFGMQTFDQALMKLTREGVISLKEALKHTTDANQFKLRMKGYSSHKDKWRGFEGDNSVENIIDMDEDVIVKMEDE